MPPRAKMRLTTLESRCLERLAPIIDGPARDQFSVFFEQTVQPNFDWLADVVWTTRQQWKAQGFVLPKTPYRRKGRPTGARNRTASSVRDVPAVPRVNLTERFDHTFGEANAASTESEAGEASSSSTAPVAREVRVRPEQSTSAGVSEAASSAPPSLPRPPTRTKKRTLARSRSTVASPSPTHKQARDDSTVEPAPEVEQLTDADAGASYAKKSDSLRGVARAATRKSRMTRSRLSTRATDSAAEHLSAAVIQLSATDSGVASASVAAISPSPSSSAVATATPVSPDGGARLRKGAVQKQAPRTRARTKQRSATSSATAAVQPTPPQKTPLSGLAPDSSQKKQAAKLTESATSVGQPEARRWTRSKFKALVKSVAVTEPRAPPNIARARTPSPRRPLLPASSSRGLLGVVTNCRTPAQMVHSFVRRNTPVKKTDKEKDAERREKLEEQERKQVEALHKKEDQLRQKMAESKRKREERMQRVAETREKQLRRDAEKMARVEQKANAAAALKACEVAAAAAAAKSPRKKLLHEAAQPHAHNVGAGAKLDSAHSKQQREQERIDRADSEMRRLNAAEQKRVAASPQQQPATTRSPHTPTGKPSQRAPAAATLTLTKPSTSAQKGAAAAESAAADRSTYDMTPQRQPVESSDVNYNIADLSSGAETDPEDAPRKRVPFWAQGTQMKAALIAQYYTPPDLDALFGALDVPNLSHIFVEQRKRFQKRTSSALWDSPLWNPRVHVADAR